MPWKWWAGVSRNGQGIGGTSGEQWIAWPYGDPPITMGSGFAVTPASDFPRASAAQCRGATRNFSVDEYGIIWQYSLAAPVTGAAAYAEEDSDAGGTGLHETALSPTVAVSGIPLGAGVRIRPFPPNDTGDADSPDRSVVYFKETGAPDFVEPAGSGVTDYGDGEVAFLEVGGGWNAHGQLAAFSSSGSVSCADRVGCCWHGWLGAGGRRGLLAAGVERVV